MTHTIRLRAAWRSEGHIHTRCFNKPTGLDGGDRVWLALDDASAIDGATLNGAPIAFSPSGRCDITSALENSNAIVLHTGEDAILLSARLEIESPYRRCADRQ